MTARINMKTISPGGYKAMTALETYVRDCGLESSLLELLRIRVSQINGCAFCIDMHTKDARAGGESEQRIYALSAWREAPFFSDRERAALAWAEAVTRLADGGVPDEEFEATRAQFDEQELANLTYAVVAINGWNRLAISFHLKVGDYQPKPR